MSDRPAPARVIGRIDRTAEGVRVVRTGAGLELTVTRHQLEEAGAPTYAEMVQALLRRSQT